MTWVPDKSRMDALIGMLASSVSPDSASQKAAYDFVESNATNTEFIRYLVYAFVFGAELPSDQRAVAASLSKSLVEKQIKHLPPAEVSYICSIIVPTLAEPIDLLRNCGANMISCIMRAAAKQSPYASFQKVWPSLPTHLAGGLASADDATLDGVLRCILQLAEDVPSMFEDNVPSNTSTTAVEDGTAGIVSAQDTPLRALYPPLISLMATHAKEDVRQRALRCLSIFLATPCVAYDENKAALYPGLTNLMLHDSSQSVREQILAALSSLLGSAPYDLWPAMPDLVSFVVSCMNPATNETATLKEACNFWTTLSELMGDYVINERSDVVDELLPYVPAAVKALVALLPLSEDDELDGDAEAEAIAAGGGADAHLADAESSVAPRVNLSQAKYAHKALKLGEGGWAAATASATNSSSASASSSSSSASGSEEEEEEGEVDDGSDPFKEEMGLWTTRRAASSALDSLATIYSKNAVPIVMGEIAARIDASVTDWRLRESGIHAFSCLTPDEDCMEVLEPQMPGAIGFMITATTDEHPRVRCAALASLRAHMSWIVEQELLAAEAAEEEGATSGATSPSSTSLSSSSSSASSSPPSTFLKSLLTVLVPCLIDPYKVVQRAALHCLSQIIKVSGEDLLKDYLPHLMVPILTCMGRVQLRSRLLVFDVLSALAEYCPETLASSPEYAKALVPPLCERVLALPDNSHEKTVLLGTISVFVPTFGLAMSAYLGPLFGASAQLLQKDLLEDAALKARGGAEVAAGAGGSWVSDHRRSSICLDILEAIVDVGGEAARELMVAHSITDTFPYTLRHSSYEVRVSSTCLLGTLALRLPALVEPFAEDAIRALVEGLKEEKRSADRAVMNNCLWALSMLAGSFGSSLAAHAPTLLPLCIDINLTVQNPSKTFFCNLALLYANIALVSPELMSHHLPSIFGYWVRMLRLAEGDELEVSYRGFLTAVHNMPSAVRPDQIRHVIEVLAQYHYKGDLPADIFAMMQAVLTDIASVTPPHVLAHALEQVSEGETREYMTAQFGLSWTQTTTTTTIASHKK